MGPIVRATNIGGTPSQQANAGACLETARRDARRLAKEKP
jgi:hypothetical protein